MMMMMLMMMMIRYDTIRHDTIPAGTNAEADADTGTEGEAVWPQKLSYSGVLFGASDLHRGAFTPARKCYTATP